MFQDNSSNCGFLLVPTSRHRLALTGSSILHDLLIRVDDAQAWVILPLLSKLNEILILSSGKRLAFFTSKTLRERLSRIMVVQCVELECPADFPKKASLESFHSCVFGFVTPSIR